MLAVEGGSYRSRDGVFKGGGGTRRGYRWVHYLCEEGVVLFCGESQVVLQAEDVAEALVEGVHVEGEY